MSPALNAANQGIIVPIIYWYNDIFRKGYIVKEDNDIQYTDLLYNKKVTVNSYDIKNIIFEEGFDDSEYVDAFNNLEDLTAFKSRVNKSVLISLATNREKIDRALKRLDMISNTYFGLVHLFTKAFFNFYPKNIIQVKNFVEENYYDENLGKKLFNNFFEFIGFPHNGKYSWVNNEIFSEKSLLNPYSKEQLEFIIRWDNEILPIMDEEKFTSFFINFLLEHLNKDIKIIDVELNDPNVNKIPGLKSDLLQAKRKIIADKKIVSSFIVTQDLTYKNKDNWYAILPESFKPLIDSQFDRLNFMLANRALYTMEGFLDKIEVNMTSYI